MRNQLRNICRWFAALSAVGACGFVLVAPLYQFHQVETSGAGTSSIRGSGTLLDANGAGVLVVLTIPLLFTFAAVLPWAGRFQRAVEITSAVVVTLFSILGSMTVGLFFAPTAVALLVLALTGGTRGRATAAPSSSSP